MAGGVYVMLVHLLTGVYCDISEEEGNLIGFNFKKNATKIRDRMVYDFTLTINCPSERSHNGRISIRAPSGPCPDGAECERAAVMVAIEALRTEYGIYPADYNYIMISEKREVYNAMRDCIVPFRGKYDELDGITKVCQKIVDNLCNQVTKWVGRANGRVDVPDIVAACGFMTSLRDTYLPGVSASDHARDLVRILLQRDNRSELEINFEQTVPMPMHIDWAGNFFLLRLLFSEAINKFNCVVNDPVVHALSGGRFKATLEISVAPYKFNGGIADSEQAARSKLMFAVLKHVNVRMGYPIFDLHYQIRLAQDIYVQRFDHKMENIFRCGMKLKELQKSCQDSFAAAVQGVLGSLDVSEVSAPIIASINESVIKMADARERFAVVWSSFADYRVTEDILRARLAGNP